MNQKPNFAHEPNLCTCLDCVALAGDARAAHDAAEGPVFAEVSTASAPGTCCGAPGCIEDALVDGMRCYEHEQLVRERLGMLPLAPRQEHTKPSLDLAGEPLGLEDDARMFHVRMVHMQLTGERDRLRDMLAALEVACSDYDREGRELAADLGQVWP